jgi:type I restriction enzyme S subunit
LLKKGDLLFNRTNSKELVGKCDVFREDGNWVFASYLIRVRLDEDKALPLFVSDFLNTPAGRIQIDRVSRQIIGMSNVNAEELRDLLIPLPPLHVQRTLINEMEAARDERRRKLAEADELLHSLDAWLLAQLGLELPSVDNRKVFAIRRSNLQGRIDPQFHLPRFENILKTISQTQHFPLGSLATFSREVWNIKEVVKQGETIFRYIEISGVNRETGEAKAEETLVRQGDIIVSLTRPHHGSIAQIDASLDSSVASTGFAVLRQFDLERVNTDYLWAVLRTQVCLQQMLQRSSGGNYPAITEDELSKILVPLPSLGTQQIVAEEARRRRIEAQRLRQEAEVEWQQAKKHFEEQLLTGDAA